MKRGPWTINDSKIVYKNPWIEVKEDKVTRPDGKPGIYGTVNIVPGVSVLPIDDEGYVYLTEEFKYAVGRNTIEAVSGGIDEGEPPLDAAKRELKEELGIRAGDWVDLGIVDELTSIVNCPNSLFLARKLSFSGDSPEGTEQIKLIKVKLEEAVKMVMDSKITHGPSCVVILKAWDILKKNH